MKTAKSDHKKLNGLVTSVQYAMFTTRSRTGDLISRPLQTLQMDSSGALWFFTSSASGKVGEIADDARVNVAYADPSNKQFVSIVGRARIVDDGAKVAELWTPAQKIFFPLGRDDPSLVLLKVVPESARFWDGHESTLGLALKFGKAVLRHEASDLGTREDLDIGGPGKH